jgi:choline dehydrogenase-like flavoprotein
LITYLDKYDQNIVKRPSCCIVGSGAAGISLAIEMIRAGQEVLLIEAGDWQEDPTLDDAYRGESSSPHPSAQEYRRQRFGGTTHLWGGRCVPLDDLDFSARAYVPNSGWPISNAELSDYLSLANNYCDAGAADYSVGALGTTAGPMFCDLQNLAPQLYERIERYSLPTDFAKKFNHELSDSSLATVLLRTRCTQLNLKEDGASVESITVSNGSKTLTIDAKCFIICGGGLETTRLMLMARKRFPAWKRFDGVLGHYYTCHYDIIFGALTFKSERPKFNFQKTTDGVYARRKLHFSPELQSKNSLLNSTFRLHFPPYADPSHGSGVLSVIYLAKSILAREHQDILNHGHGVSQGNQKTVHHIRNIFFNISSVFSFGFDWLFKMKLAKRRLPYTLIPNQNGSYPLEFNSEQVPNINNRIELLAESDSNGMPRIAIHWKLTQTDIESGIESFKCLQSLLSKTEQCQLEFDPDQLREQIAAAQPVGGHHIGTTRMGESDTDSVVDKNCKAHGVSNLYVVSASVFPTCSHANPTLTIVALALRLAEHLSSMNKDQNAL